MRRLSTLSRQVKQTMSAYHRIYAIVRQIPLGQVATYGQVAELAGMPGQARLVGYALYRVASSAQIPWHRVVNAKGTISESPFRYGADHIQRSLLEQEGIPFDAEGRINLAQYRWQPRLTASTVPPTEGDSAAGRSA